MEKQKKLAIVHYNEIALKGKNRAFFERALIHNIENKLQNGAKAKRISGRVLLEFEDDVKRVREDLQKIFGIKHFSFVKRARADMGEIKSESLSFFEKPYPESFKIEASRSEKTYPFTSQDLAIEVGAHIQKNAEIRVDLEHPAKSIFIEVVEGSAYIYDEKIQGPGGMPVGTAGKVMSLISPGFDSPIASLKMMKRGCEVEFVHFHSYPQTTRDSIESVEKIVGVLSRYSPFPLKLNLVSFLDIQKRIIKDVPLPYAVIMYRRWMLKISEILAQKSGAKALITGDSVGQVASQTLDNIFVISEAVSMPILRPLVGCDKEEIIDEARVAGTHDISSLPYDDCCNLFTSGSPETHGKIEYVKKAEDPIQNELQDLAEMSLKNAEIKTIK